MKKLIKNSILLLMAVPLLLISCAKNDALDKQNLNTANNSQVKTTPTDLVYCGTPVVYPMVDYAQTISPATVTIGNDGINLLIKYQLNTTDWYINKPDLFVGTQEELTPYLTAGGFNFAGSGTAQFNTDVLILEYNSQWADYGTYWEKIIPLSSLPDCFVVVAFARIRNVAENAVFKDIFGKSTSKTSGYYFNYCVQHCSTPLGGCETGYAYGGNIANCFLTIPGVTSNNWGWSNGPIGAGTYTWPMYAGAGQCNIGNGTHVGNLTVNYTPPTATVTYSVFDAYVLNATHLYVGTQILPKKNGKFTTAPGQFPYKHENLNGVNTDTYNITGLSGNIYVAAHSGVCDDIN